MRQMTHAALGASIVASVLATARPAHSDPSGWVHFGSGAYGWQMASSESFKFSPSLAMRISEVGESASISGAVTGADWAIALGWTAR